MNFQGFCSLLEDSDGLRSQQSVTTNNTFVISFAKDGGTAFSVDPVDIVNFLEFLRDRHSECVQAIESDPRYKADSYLVYDEKPYRALYRLCSDNISLKNISSLGGSQTKAITQVISKLIAYVAELEYQGVAVNTLFDIDSVNAALDKMPENLISLESGNDRPVDVDSNKDRFVQWLRNRKLSERTIKSYADTAMNIADQTLRELAIFEHSLYKVLPISPILSAIDLLSKDPSWRERNEAGNEMYQRAIKLYADFLKETFRVDVKGAPLPKPFLLLAGISGTGKSRFIRKQSEASNPINPSDSFCLVPVRPDWHEPSDLLGYVSRIDKPKYITTKVLAFIIRAWKHVAPNASATGAGKLDMDAPPYWLCLDEMNLAPVEQYFADYLSVLETREYNETEGYRCEPLLDLKALNPSGDLDLQNDLGLSENDELWTFFKEHGIGIPPNLLVAGTVNMDETTHGFSRKVIDRALTLDYGEFYPNEFDLFYAGQPENHIFHWSLFTTAKPEDLADTYDADGTKSIAFLKAVNQVLKRTPFELAYRALNELLLYVACFQPKNNSELQAVWDDFLMTKVLPRIDGDDDKLRVVIDGKTVNLLGGLEALLEGRLSDIWDASRPDLFRKVKAGISCRSRAKLKWMSDKLESHTFTSYWP
ncbi:hypothetical protein [uncultured Endozoicomonas sp.]|uniref:McrB family protein n=1 Tax=uncultured Endozoicomonas sp. TaxID=432652 RepID=UPI0026137E79|nr:hypothetical protein [uncultured Endozoicomonas sp.]